MGHLSFLWFLSFTELDTPVVVVILVVVVGGGGSKIS